MGLRRCLAYPDVIAAFDDDLQRALRVCGLEGLAGQLDREADWSSELSLDARQRLVFARLIARWPEGVHWLVLDQIDTALDSEQALQMYDGLQNHVPVGAGLVISSRHPEMAERQGWRHYALDPSRSALDERFLPLVP